MVQKDIMTTTSMGVITEALKLGLSIYIRARNGGTISLGTNRVYRNARRKVLSSEYSLTQSILPDTRHTASKPEEIARMAFDLAGDPLVYEAQRLVSKFLSKNQGMAN